MAPPVRSLAVCSLFLGAAATTLPSGPPTLQDGSFEEGGSSWHARGNVGYKLGTGCYDGMRCIVVATKKDKDRGGAWQAVNYPGGIQGTIQVGAWTRANKNAFPLPDKANRYALHLYITLANGTTEHKYMGFRPTQAGRWHHSYFNVTPDQHVTSLNISLELSSVKAIVYFDSVSLNVNPSTTTQTSIQTPSRPISDSQQTPTPSATPTGVPAGGRDGGTIEGQEVGGSNEAGEISQSQSGGLSQGAKIGIGLGVIAVACGLIVGLVIISERFKKTIETEEDVSELLKPSFEQRMQNKSELESRAQRLYRSLNYTDPPSRSAGDPTDKISGTSV